MTATYQPVSQRIPAAPPAPRPAGVSQATAIEQSRAVAQVQAQIIVAQNCPRDIQRATAEMRESCGMLAMAEQAFYQVHNRGTGPSVHLMRELARIWGNIEHGSKELARTETGSEIEAYAWDMQANSRTSRTYIVPHARMKAGSRQVLTDLGDITNNNNNVAARAVRECISNVLPRWFTEQAQNVCRQTLEHGEGEPLADRIKRMVDAFGSIGITATQMETKLGKKRGQWDAGDVAQMGIVYTSITRDGQDRNELFPPVVASEVKANARKQPEPTPTADVPMANDRQIKAIIVALKAAEDFKDDPEGRQARLDWLSAWAQRPIGSTKELTRAEAAQLLSQLQPAPEEPAQETLT